MIAEIMKTLPQFLETLGLDEEPMGIFYTAAPASGANPSA